MIIRPLRACRISRRMRLLWISLAALCTLNIAVNAPARGDHLLDEYELRCDPIFPCPAELQRRIDLWVEVFSKYGDKEIILHDAEHPERIFAVHRETRGCSRKHESRALKRQKKRLRKQLLSVADKLARKTSLDASERHLAGLFPGGDAKEVRRAAQRIRCQDGGRDRFAAALTRYGRHRAMVAEMLADGGLPQDIVYLPFVESAYNPLAYSRVGAAGLWQIMPRTARNLGLELNAELDERLDPRAATAGAVRYLQRSIQTLSTTAKTKGGWNKESIYPFVITSYNYGVAGMRRAVRQVGPDFVKVLQQYRGRSFRVAVKNFYASFLAARHVARNAKHFFPDVVIPPPAAHVYVRMDRPTSVERVTKQLGVPVARLRALNPALTSRVWDGYRLIPSGYRLGLPQRKDGWQIHLAAMNALPAEQPKYKEEFYRVRRGDTACGIAGRFSVSCRELIRWNKLGRRALIRVGQQLSIPTPGPRKVVTAAARPEAPPLGPGGPPQPLSEAAISEALGIGDELQVAVRQIDGQRRYTIRVEPEETLGHYADWLGVGVAGPLRRLNGLRSGRALPVGKVIKLPIKNDRQRARFERQRRAFHATLEAEFKAHFRVAGVRDYRVRQGDSGWLVAKRAEVPLWLLRRFNPELLRRGPRVGAQLRIPVLKARRPEAVVAPPRGGTTD